MIDRLHIRYWHQQISAKRLLACKCPPTRSTVSRLLVTRCAKDGSAEHIIDNDANAKNAQVIRLASELGVEQEIIACLAQEVPGIMRRSPTAVFAKIKLVANACSVPADRVTNLLATDASLFSMLLCSPAQILSKLEAIASVVVDEKQCGNKQDALHQAFLAAEAQPQMLALDLHNLHIRSRTARELKDFN